MCPSIGFGVYVSVLAMSVYVCTYMSCQLNFTFMNRGVVELLDGINCMLFNLLVTARIRNLYDYQLRLLHNIMPVPSGVDVANTLKYFSQTLLSKYIYFKFYLPT